MQAMPGSGTAATQPPPLVITPAAPVELPKENEDSVLFAFAGGSSDMPDIETRADDKFQYVSEPFVYFSRTANVSPLP